MIRNVQHIGIAVQSIERARMLWEGMLGMSVSEITELPERGVRLAMIDGKNVNLELLEPLGEDSPIAAFIAKRGEGIHHIALGVDSIDEAVAGLEQRGIRFVTPGPVEGAHGSRIIFISPKSGQGVLLELCEETKTRSP